MDISIPKILLYSRNPLLVFLKYFIQTTDIEFIAILLAKQIRIALSNT